LERTNGWSNFGERLRLVAPASASHRCFRLNRAHRTEPSTPGRGKKKTRTKEAIRAPRPSVPPYWFSSLASAVGTRCEVHCNDVAMAVITGTAAWLGSG
jgi:hypothetical protein